MLSIFIMYSNDRAIQLAKTVSCLMDMDGYEQCQKTLVVDTKLTTSHLGLEVVEVPRRAGRFCWADMWQAGVDSARHEPVLYLDSDRLLPKDYISTVMSNVADDRFLFCSTHYMLRRELSLSLCKELLVQLDFDPSILLKEEYLGALEYEQRYQNPIHGPGKNVMSGNTAFTRKTFLKLGGVDGFYCGHGAFADTDFHLQASVAGCEFVDLMRPELHCGHSKNDWKGTPLTEGTLRRMGLDNFIYYCCKWGLSLRFAEHLARACHVVKPIQYVKRVAKGLNQIVSSCPQEDHHLESQPDVPLDENRASGDRHKVSRLPSIPLR